MKGVFVAHPGLQHSHQLAWALYERGLLQAYWSGVPVVADDEMLPFWLPAAYAKRVKQVPIPLALRRHPLLFQTLLRAGALLPSAFSVEEFGLRIFHLYDWWVSRHIRYLKPKVVVAYEISAYHTFKAAKAIGARCILDAAAFHHSAGTRLNINTPTLFRKEINCRKDIETDLADLILTCSPLAAESYRSSGVPEYKLQPVLLGSALPTISGRWQKHQEPLRFIFAGALRYLKSIDLLLSVFKRLHDEQIPAQITFVGGVAETKWLDEIQRTPNANYYPNIAQTQLFEMLAAADCLLLPSRLDSFGMVVAEAMACGTPAIVSTQTGAKAMIEQFPNSGWIIEPDVEGLYQCVRERIENREELFAARQYALEAAKHFTWQAYRQRVGQIIQDFVVA